MTQITTRAALDLLRKLQAMLDEYYIQGTWDVETQKWLLNVEARYRREELPGQRFGKVNLAVNVQGSAIRADPKAVAEHITKVVQQKLDVATGKAGKAIIAEYQRLRNQERQE